MRPARGLLDTSVLIASESGRALDVDGLPEESYISVVTLAELQLGVLAAADTETRAGRLRTLDAVGALEPLVIDSAVAAHWARLRMALAEVERRMNVNDLWIAALSAANDLPVITQDDDFSALDGIPGIEVHTV